MKCIIVIWSGAVVDIPAGWALCDGNNGTPDLRDKLVIGAGGSLNPGEQYQSNVDAGLKKYLHALCFIMKL